MIVGAAETKMKIYKIKTNSNPNSLNHNDQVFFYDKGFDCLNEGCNLELFIVFEIRLWGGGGHCPQVILGEYIYLFTNLTNFLHSWLPLYYQ